MWEDCWAPLRVLFEVSGHEFKVKPVSGVVCFSPAMVSHPGRDAEWIEKWT